MSWSQTLRTKPESVEYKNATFDSEPLYSTFYLERFIIIYLQWPEYILQSRPIPLPGVEAGKRI